jgi:hypothetical protein
MYEKASSKLFYAVFVCCAAAALASPNLHAQIDGAFIQKAAPERAAPASSDIPDYESDYAAAARLQSKGGSTPEADGRPGEYYFLLGADAFRKGNAAFAIQMYQVSASWAYKPAEYNLGVMYARGQGVPVDLPRGLAWMALASERAEKHYVDAREAIYAEMSKQQFEQANVIWRELKPTYADEVALRRAKARWAEVRANMTGSRVGSTGNLQVGTPSPSSPNASLFIMRGRAQPEAHPGLSPQNVKGDGVGFRTAGSTSAEVLGGEGTPGVVAYRQLRESDNPYDPKFDRAMLGTATVGQPTPAKKENPKEPAASDTTDGTRHNG